MERHLNLIKNRLGQKEKRVLPRFPYCFLTFKSDEEEKSKVFEVRDISYTGMQIALRDGGHTFEKGNVIKGQVHWLGNELFVAGMVKWVTNCRLGVSFNKDKNFVQSVRDFLSVKNMVAGLRPLHRPELGLELPSTLKYWLRADGPIELFVWQHKDGEFSRVQMIMLQNFVEWEDGTGIKTGISLSNRNIETPLNEEDEFIFEIDPDVDREKIHLAFDIVTFFPKGLLPETTVDFLKLKLGPP